MRHYIEETRLKPCPFCGGEKNLGLTTYDFPGGEGFVIECYDCCEGPWHTTKKGAVKMWNKRAKRKMWNKIEKKFGFS